MAEQPFDADDSQRTPTELRLGQQDALESLFHAVWQAEANARLDDRIDLALGVRRAAGR